MASGTTTVGAIKYDSRLDLDELRKSVAEADKIVEKAYKNQAKAAKKAAKTSTSSSGNSTAYDAQTRVNAIKREAQETAKTLATYTPQIQKQFLTVERANNQVANATTRSNNAIQRYGANSAQATNATNALNVAVQNQSQQQSKLTSMLNGTYKSQNNFATSMADSVIAIGGVVAGLGILTAAYNTINRSISVANQFEASIAGLSRLSVRFGYDATQATNAARSLAEDGLITVTTAAEGLQKLLTAGVGLPDAIKLMQGYKDQAAFGKSSTLDLDTAVGNLAESFYTENSAIGNLSGQTENWNRILEYGASVLGKSVSQLSEKERVQAKLIGQQRLNNLVEGDAAALANTNAANQARLNQTLLEMQTTIGRVTNQISGGFIGSLGGMNEEGQKMAIAFGAGTTAFVGFLTIVPLAITSFRTIRSVIVSMGVASAFASGGITALLGALAAVGTGVAVASLIDELEDVDEMSEKFSENVKEASGGLGASADNAAKTAKQIAKINEQMEEARENYRYSLAQLVAEKNENIATLTQTLSEEEDAYNNAYSERLASFNKTQNEELLTHEQKTRALQNQIDFLTKYNTAANKKQLSELQFALARENAEYQKSTQLKKAEFDEQTASEMTEYQKRRDENQKKLNEELSLLNKHREEVLSVRNVMLLDEVETLKKQRNEQLKSLAQQRQDIVSSNSAAGSEAGSKWASNYMDEVNKIKDKMKTSGKESSKNWYIAWREDFNTRWLDFWENAVKWIMSPQDDAAKRQMRSSGGWATGGFTGRGGVNEPAGIVHKGEYVLPQEQVNQSTGLPKDGVLGGGSTTNLSINLAGLVFNTKSDKRAFANEIAKLINESSKAKIGSIAIEGI